MKKLPDRELLCYSYIAFRPWNHWNVRSTIGTPARQLERAKHYWNCPKGNWNVRSTIGTPEGHIFSAERSVRADNRSCSAIRGFLCVRVLGG